MVVWIVFPFPRVAVDALHQTSVSPTATCCHGDANTPLHQMNPGEHVFFFFFYFPTLRGTFCLQKALNTHTHTHTRSHRMSWMIMNNQVIDLNIPISQTNFCTVKSLTVHTLTRSKAEIKTKHSAKTKGVTKGVVRSCYNTVFGHSFAHLCCYNLLICVLFKILMCIFRFYFYFIWSVLYRPHLLHFFLRFPTFVGPVKSLFSPGSFSFLGSRV